MTVPWYADAIDDALDRLRDVGFEFGPDFAVHAPMVAETLVTLGRHDVTPAWIAENRRLRGSYEPPAAGDPIPEGDPAEVRRALGDFRRVTDWAVYFERQLASRPWREVVVEWWPVLLDGAFAAFTHGLIRTAHAVRSLNSTPRPSALQLGELARGLAYWAARYVRMPAGSRRTAGPPGPEPRAEDVPALLSELTAANAGRYAEQAPRPPVPLVHSITAPAAVRMVLPILPDELRVRSYLTAERVAAVVWSFAPGFGAPGPQARADRPPGEEQLLAEAVELGEEHVIKLAEACVREYGLRPDRRYLLAAHTLNTNCKQLGGKRWAIDSI